MQQSLVLKDLFGIATYQERLAWQPFREGIEIYRLYGDGRQGASAALLRYQPGARVPHHQHLGFEHVLVLSGAQRDRNGEHRSGTLVVNPPQSIHQVCSDAGCIVLVIWEKPISLWS
ncbi:transcription negative regulator ChrR [Synechococcales cyanobacterium C]|uniref:Transcription negative regulator ChrR n=1 Tax=Petrachloros mirabilis ULC683 TaxID=2781853 RepID=A0A8K2A1F6_9CYAN|nr:cupin domain-containing protein [Petrachloros mirabilis]NCJ08733.1 transcription negative regulator ChrR [Petrachloros mirabilis ULC683]